MFDPARATLRYKIASGRCLGVTWLCLGSTAIVEAAARAKPDAIVIDMQHGLWDRRDLEAAIGIVPSDIPVIVRTAENTPHAISSALDAGAEGIMVPLIETAKQARKAVSHMRFPPLGSRSAGGVRPLADFANYVEGSDKLVLMVMIETARGADNAAKIAATDGVDMVFIGTGDLGLSLGTFPKMHHDHTIACADIHRACKKEWMPCGIFTPDLAAARARRQHGYHMVVTSSDVELVSRNFKAIADGFAPAPPVPPSKVDAASGSET